MAQPYHHHRRHRRRHGRNDLQHQHGYLKCLYCWMIYLYRVGYHMYYNYGVQKFHFP